MNEYAVVWEPDAEDMLALVWLAAPNRNAVAAAQAAADALLATDPLAYADHVREGLWRPTVLPIAVYFSIDEAARRVEVSAVRLAPR
jgi:hypothetical protein